ncbi:MAG: YoaP domain-containing protein [Candidatus Marinimicrobia bacterium]|nr:YoaP domain-containing protein [Candidatus Neomarinimicrobiota bacterium]
MDNLQIIPTTPESVKLYGLCGYKDVNKPGYSEKLDWYAKNKSKGLVIKVLHSNVAGTQGMIEYIDGEYCWRPVSAPHYLFIHCLFVGFKKEYKQRGFASRMLADCFQDAIARSKAGIAVMVRKGSFMANADIFLKNGFEPVENIAPDFQLLVKKVQIHASNPVYINNDPILNSRYQKGLTILRADQCPYTVKNVQEMVRTAEEEFDTKVRIIHINSHQEAQENPSPFGTFALILNGKILSHHPISKTRLVNILRTEL